MSDPHEHDFGEPAFRLVGMCGRPGCDEMRVGTKRGGWRTLTPNERTNVTIHMLEDLIGY
ncbi:MAG: hypothetical protein ACREKK_05530 [Candidatus Methylomirabilales bacterium]